MIEKGCDILVFMNAPSPYWRNFAEYLGQYYSINFIFYSTCSELGRPKFWDLEMPANCSIVRDGVIRRKSYFYDKKVVSRIKRHNPKVVVSQGVNLVSAWNALNYCKKSKIHFSIWNETWRNKSGRHRKIASLIYAYLFRHSNSSFSSSQEGIEFWSGKYNFPTKAYYVPANVDKYLTHQKTHDSFLNILFGHRLIDQFNPLGAFEIAKIINKTIPVKLYMNGSGYLRGALERLILSETTNFVEFIDVKKYDELEEYYRQSHVAISPCHYSPGFIGNNEALASGCPIFISENVGYHDLQIEAADIGLVLPLDNKIFAEKILEIYSNKALYYSMSANAKAYIKQTLSNSAVLKLYDEIFSSMGAEQKPLKKI